MYWSAFNPLKVRISCQTWATGNNKEKALSDLQTVRFWALRKARKIADNELSQKKSADLGRLLLLPQILTLRKS
jgi:hypothetical protein